jgi:hypothetical protein
MRVFFSTRLRGGKEIDQEHEQRYVRIGNIYDMDHDAGPAARPDI